MKNKFLAVVCFIYSLLIIFVWFNGSLSNFLAPNMQIYLKLSIIPMIIMGIVIILNKIHYKYKSTDLVLLLPIIMVFLAGDGNLTITLACNKINRVKNNDEEIIEYVPEDNYDFDNVYFDVKDETYSYLANYITYMTGAKKFVGKTIRVKGFSIDYSDFLLDGYYAIGKYAITCCAADAEIAGFIIKTDEKIKQNEWYEVEGVLEQAKDNEGYNIMVINVINIKKSNPDKTQYVYSCETYGKDACKELQKYDFEY